MCNVLIAQSGGPTAAINATLAGVIAQAKIQDEVGTVYGGINGIEGILKEHFVDLNLQIKNTTDLDRLTSTPAAALGSCRFKLADPQIDDSQYQKLITIFRKYSISWFIYIGGNDSMDTVDKLSAYCHDNQINDIKIIGAPKTIDNDLVGIDHCPGFPSAAKYIATTIQELERDLAVYHSFGVTIVEIMGRNAGWLTAAAALPRLTGSRGADLIYLCECPFDQEQFLNDILTLKSQNRNILVAVSEGVKDKEGHYLTESLPSGAADVFGHQDIAGTGMLLANLIRERIGCKVRSIELNLMQRCAGHLASQTDLAESRLLGAKALQTALAGNNAVMVTLTRESDSDNKYRINFSQIPVSQVANREKTVPRDWISPAGNDITPAMIDYLTPLVDLDPANYYILY